MTPLDPHTHTPTHTHIHQHTYVQRVVKSNKMDSNCSTDAAVAHPLCHSLAPSSSPLSSPISFLSVSVRLFFAASSNIYEGDTLFTSIQRCRCLRQWLRQKVVRDEDDETQQEAGQEAGKRACCGRGIAHFYIHTNCQGTYVMPKTDMKILSRAQLPVSHTGSQCEI